MLNLLKLPAESNDAQIAQKMNTLSDKPGKRQFDKVFNI
jgi:hypothetical protein